MHILCDIVHNVKFVKPECQATSPNRRLPAMIFSHKTVMPQERLASYIYGKVCGHQTYQRFLKIVRHELYS